MTGQEIGSSRLVPDQLQHSGKWLAAWNVYLGNRYIGYLTAERHRNSVMVACAGLAEPVNVSSIGVGVRLMQAVMP